MCRLCITPLAASILIVGNRPFLRHIIRAGFPCCGQCMDREYEPLERIRGIEPLYSAWKADVLADVLHPHMARLLRVFVTVVSTRGLMHKSNLASQAISPSRRPLFRTSGDATGA